MRQIMLLIIFASMCYGAITVNSFMNSAAGTLIMGFIGMVLPVLIILGIMKIWWVATDQDGKEEQKMKEQSEKYRQQWEKDKKNREKYLNNKKD